MMEDLGIDKMKLRILTDASAAKGIASRRGLGKIRHIEVNQLWLQDKVSSGDIEVIKVNGKTNIADPLTKYVDQDGIRKQFAGTHQRIVKGRHRIMPIADLESIARNSWEVRHLDIPRINDETMDKEPAEEAESDKEEEERDCDSLEVDRGSTLDKSYRGRIEEVRAFGIEGTCLASPMHRQSVLWGNGPHGIFSKHLDQHNFGLKNLDGWSGCYKPNSLDLLELGGNACNDLDKTVTGRNYLLSICGKSVPDDCQGIPIVNRIRRLEERVKTDPAERAGSEGGYEIVPSLLCFVELSELLYGAGTIHLELFWLKRNPWL